MTTNLPASLLPGIFWVPSVQNTTTNMAAELEQAVVDNPGRKIIVIANAPFLIDGFGAQGILTNETVNIDFGSTTIVHNNTSVCIDIDNNAAHGAEVVVSAVADVLLHGDSESTEITISSTLNALAHDWIALYSEDANPSKSGGKLGEIIQLIKDESALKLYTTGKVCRTSDFSSTIRCRKLDATRKFRIHGGMFAANGDSDDGAITTRQETIRVLGIVDPKIENVEFEKPWAQCIWLQCTAGAIVNNYEVRDSLNMAGSNGYSYGVVLYGMNGNATITNATVRNARHAAGTTDGNSGGTSTWYNKGYPTHYTFSGIRGYNSYGSICDSHEEGFYGAWNDIVVHSSATEEHQIFTGSAIQGRAAKETWSNIRVIGGPRAMTFDDVDHGFEDEVIIENVTCRDIHDTTGTAATIEFKNNGQTNIRHYKLKQISLDDIDTGLWVGQNNKVTFHDFTGVSHERLIDAQAGSDIVGTKLVSDSRNSTAFGGIQIINCRSNSGDGGCSVRILDNPIVMRGDASNRPTEFFTESDTTAAKTVYCGDIIEYNPDGVTTILKKESGHTTLNDATDIITVSESQTLTGPGAVSLTTKITHVVTTGVDALTLADGYEGQEKMIVMQTDGGAGTLTPSNLGNGTTITFDDVGDSASLLFTNGSWHFMGGTATLA